MSYHEFSISERTTFISAFSDWRESDMHVYFCHFVLPGHDFLSEINLINLFKGIKYYHLILFYTDVWLLEVGLI